MKTKTKRYQGFPPSTYGEHEALAGVTDRIEFWRDKNEAQARAELRRMVRERVNRGELSLCYTEARA